MRAARWLLAVLAGLWITVVVAGPAYAHDALRSADPADGATLSAPPTAVRLTFGAQLDARYTQLAVTDPAGASVSAGPVAVAGDTVTRPVAITSAGRYTVAYRIVSRDGHPVTGTLRFTVTMPGNPPGSPAPALTQRSEDSTPQTTEDSTPQTAAATAGAIRVVRSGWTPVLLLWWLPAAAVATFAVWLILRRVRRTRP